ncbi:ABC transporter ATP-binding protein [Paenibacillus chitinolyticus]|uniref:ABC transporter ATP-binding protein n=1 Tax=Paenibacillus chitinolyticus TaxID=79263 RepID=A0A410WPL5_9BACL|nr:ABC transporter ATP-binding protein [Paenibacillus chitinolyticus]MCY9590835.1 ABC transporter ATP-binding protein/permease [Paenibacillus chitinolyticus]MCY9598742.1 ABC transporter ATP-binding protein/permease [Paenibacillus chitinolyticus]QAV16281.1 ABC transporter ATP-binding protein [Paenibacillus chitinolyticus]
MPISRKYISKYWKPFSAAVAFLTLEALCDLTLPTLMSKIIDVGVGGKQMDYVWRMGGIMLLVTALGAISASVRNVISSHVSQKFGAELRSDLFRKIQSLSFENIDRFDRASLVTRLTNDVTQVQMFVNGLMRVFVKAPLLCIGSLIMAARLNPPLSVILAVVVPVVGILIAINMKVGFPYFIKVQQALDRVNGIMREYLSGVRVVKAFNRFDYEVGKFGRANEEYRSRSVTAMRVMSAFNPGITLTVNFGIVAVLWLGGLRVDQGQMQAGHIIAFVNYMTQILFSLMLISMVFNMFVRARASAGRIGEIFAEENTMAAQIPVTTAAGGSSASSADKPASGTLTGMQTGGSVEFENVTFSYEGASGEPVLRRITFSCEPGQTVGIIGSTGSGKSTLVSLIPRFYDAVSGTVKVNGTDVRELEPSRLREKIAVVPQKTVLFTGTVADNLRWGKEDASPEEMEHAARMAEAHEFIAASPEGYETRLGQGGVNFSGGQKQRLSIARAIVRKPDILILDDCTSAVDAATEARIKDALKKYAEGLTCLLIAQRITSVMDADKIVVLDRGEIVGSGTHDELLGSCRVYREIFQSQMGKEVG